MKTIKFFLYLIMAVPLVVDLNSCSTMATSRKVNFDKAWKFHLGDLRNAEMNDFNDADWRVLDLPHDWSIEGAFSDTNRATPGGGALPGGVGWYRKSFKIPSDEKDKKIYLRFDGVYMNSTVWLNGHLLGNRPNGYISFRYDLTPYIKWGRKNVVAVKVDNSKQPNSRWYSGSGIYRNVWLITTSKIAVDQWGTYIRTPEVGENKATVDVSTTIRNDEATDKTIKIVTSLIDADGKIVASDSLETATGAGKANTLSQKLTVDHPVLWSIEKPVLYTAHTQLKADGKVQDDYTTEFGIRYFEFDADKGFSLNGKHLKINGVCDHHDLGCLGAAINTRAIERQLEILKAMGCNGIRTSHNPPAPELLELCDRMGFIVLDEMFDMWKKKKTEYDFSLYWDHWHAKDIHDFIMRDRNHPSVVIWSIGNEILEQWDTSGIPVARELAGIVRSLDTTRPITSACNDPKPSNYIIRSGALDLIGYNYHQNEYASFHDAFPGKKFIATETVSSLATRGHYDMPSDSIRRWPVRWDIPFTGGNPDHTCSAYDNCSAPWGSTNEETWKIIRKYDFLSGQFIWTGWDYLGEPTPYGWPSRSSYFGLIDLAGFPKDSYYMYQSEWTEKNVLHVFPHWNWNKGDTVDVWAYFNCDEAELFLNGKSMGTKKKVGDALHVMWRLAYEPGTIKVVGRTGGKEVMTREIKTAGKPAQIRLTPDRAEISADGRDLSFVTVDILDADGNLVPTADNLVKFDVTGDGFIAGVDNGCQTSMESFKADHRKAFNGKCLVVIQNNGTKGKIEVKATSDGLKDTSVEITAQ